ncbi:MAG: DNA primase [Thiohalocapsa sp.]
MIGRITPEFKERLLARIDVVDIVGLRVQLKKAGKEFSACCPFHNEKTPSFTVSADKQFYHCFGCGAHGNAIDFLIEFDRLSYPEAVEELAQQAGLELPAANHFSPQGPDPTPLYAIMERAAELYSQQLREHKDAPRAIIYLKNRGLSGEIVKQFDIGYAPPGWDFLRHTLGGDHGDQQQLITAGLLAERDDRRYDRFRDRIMFPIRDRRGRVIGFGGRVLDAGEPKYLNSPETPVFHKGRELYGLYQAQQAARRPARLLVVEGYMDVIALAQYDIPYAVATLGTATTPEHIKRLLRGAPELVFCFDGDRAGREAAWKAVQTALPLATGQQPIRFLFLPDGEDPDSLVRAEGREGFERRIADAALLSDYLFRHLTDDLDLASAEGRAKLDTDARALIQTMPASTFRGLLEKRLAVLVGLGGQAGRRRPSPPGAGRRHAGRTQPLTPLRCALALLLDQPALARRATEQPTDWQSLDNPGVPLLREVIDIACAYPGLTTATLCERWRDQEHEQVIRRLSDSGLIAHIPSEGREAEFLGVLASMNREAQRMNREAEHDRRWRMIQSGRASISGDEPTEPAVIRNGNDPT